MQVINGAGHHVYADRSEIFNKYVQEACALSDSTSRLTSANLRSYPKAVNEQEINVVLPDEAFEASRPKE